MNRPAPIPDALRGELQALRSAIETNTQIQAAGLQQWFTVADLARRWAMSRPGVIAHLQQHGVPTTRTPLRLALATVLRVEAAMRGEVLKAETARIANELTREVG